MKAVFLSGLVLLALASCIYAEESKGAGLRGAVNESIISSVIKYMSPDIIKLVSDIRAPDQSFKAGKVKVTLSDIHAQVTNYSPEMIHVDFLTPNIINVKIINLKARGGFHGKFKWAFISDKERVDFDFKSVNLDLNIQFTTREVEGKLLPDGKFTKFDLNLDFDFSFHGSVLSKILSIVKKPIKKAIIKAVNKVINDQSNKLLQSAIQKIPPYVKIKDNGYAVDYTFIETPKIENDFVLFNSFGAFINQNIPETLVQHFPLEKDVPEYDVNGKQVQIYASNFVINTAIYTLYTSKSLNVTLTPEMMPSKVPIELTTKWLSALFGGMVKVFGEDKQCELGFAVAQNPIIDFKEDVMSLTLPSEIRVNVRNSTNETENGNYTITQAIKFRGNFSFDIDFHVEEQGNISAFVHELKLSNTSITESVLPEAKESTIETTFNLMGSIIKPLVNSYLKNYLNITIPTVEGIKFTDMTIDHHKNYLRVHYNLTYENRTFFRTELFDDSNAELFDITQVKCSDGKIIKKAKLVTDKYTKKMYYEVECVNPDFYAKSKKRSTCPNGKETLREQKKSLKKWRKQKKIQEKNLKFNYQLF